MKICAIMLDYRGADKTARCLESLADQGLSAIYVVDNCDHADWSARLEKTLAGFRAANPDIDVRLLNTSGNLGFANGVNFAIKADRNNPQAHAFYLLINNDATAEPGLLTGLLQAFKEDRNVFLAAPCIAKQNAPEECGLWYNRYSGIQSGNKLPLSFQFISGCCMLIDARLIENNELFDSDFFMYGEDAALCWKMRQENQRYKLVNDVHVQHEVGASSKKAGLFYEYHTARGHVLLGLKARRYRIEIPVILLTKFFTLGARALFRCLSYRSLVPAQAFLLAWFPLKIRMP